VSPGGPEPGYHFRVTLTEIQAGRAGFVPALARAGLHVLSWGWRLGNAARGAAFDLGLPRPTRLDVPVISVGNIAVGGTGKTPFVIWLAKRLIAAGHSPGILARGYGDASADDRTLNDEGAVILRALGDRVPQVQDPDRVRGGSVLRRTHPEVDVILLDDGFQHRRIARDLDIVLLDAMRPFGYGHVLPRGLLREPPKALRRAGAVILTRTERVAPETVEAAAVRVRALIGRDPAQARSEPAPSALVEELSGASVLACCGIGNPEAFVGTLEDLGARVVARHLLHDHEALPAEAWPDLLAEAKAAGAECIAVTRKDAVKYAHLPPEVTVVDVETVISAGEDALWKQIEGVFPESPH